MRAICAWCSSYGRKPKKWTVPGPTRETAHGICKECTEEVRKEFLTRKEVIKDADKRSDLDGN
jgi:hypothetical protein